MHQLFVRRGILADLRERVTCDGFVCLTDVNNFLRVGIHHPENLLSVVYHRRCEELLALFGVNLSDAAKDQAMFTWPATHLVGDSPDTDEGTIPFPVRVRQEFHA